MLDLGHNRLAELPVALGELTALRFLYVSHNRLASLPNSLGRLRNLTYLNLTGNALTELPAWIGDLQSLIELRLYITRSRLCPVPSAACLRCASYTS